ncbi:kinesin-like protein Klp61F isoform X3 [Solenopsis invicta]|uniref:kinesin-like protein Klp61F isoform X3 n=1 Tax=Solenopsis invicta TaxID=13686 RepID=UPI00193D1D8F|nr:kinesin-like protein Klp61F isoform X3 [Solenopsis invicta]
MSENDQHINVFVRIKPVSKTSTLEKCVTKAVSNKEIIIYERSQDEQASKKFSFDGVFGPSSTQLDVYNAVINPLLKEVIAGYSCTVFAYGQTGTGKTYTMEGDYANNLNWQSDTSAGIIPRSLDHLFDELQLLENQQYAIRVSFLELYNEELIDLLTNNNSPSKIKLYDDITKKGSVIIHGLEEVTVQNKTDIYRILEKGSNRRHTAATMLNSNSSRSHTVFTIMICTKENTSGGEELLKTARLNLVDLAGSEQIARSGAVDKRMREAKTINQSLLTLGRVITALVEKTPHVPYRESKLTRLLQESLGGRMKTSIIATVSSVSTNLEETRSTLDYAHRAKNITNRPEINQKVCKRELLREYTKEIESLKKDLLATREKNGICVSYDDCEGMRTLIDRQRKELQEKNNYCKVLQDTLESKEKIFNDFQSQYDAQVNELTKTMTKLKDVNGTLQMTKKMLNQVKHEKNAHERFVEKYVQNEKILLHQIDTVLDVVNEASEDAQKLHDKLDRETKTEEKYGKVGLQMMDDITERCGNITDCAFAYENEIHRFLNSLKNQVETHLAERAKNIETSIRTIVNHAIYQHAAASKELKTDINTSKMKNMSHGLNILDNCEKNYSKLVNASHQIDKACSNVYDQISHDEFNQNDLKNYLHILTPSINSDIDSGINQAQILNKTAFENKNVLIIDLQERLNNSYFVSNQHNNKVQFTGKQLKEKMHKNEEKILISGANIFRMVENMSEAHVTFMEKQKSKISDVSRTIESNLVNQCTELNNYKNNIIEKLSESQRRIDEFVSDANFWRTIPTGTTPEKKNFSYPREFATISLSERICQRFQEDRNGLDEENNLDPTFKLSKFEVSSIENRTLFTSTPYKSPNTVYPNTNNSDYPNTSNSFIATVSATALSQTLEPSNSLRAGTYILFK